MAVVDKVKFHEHFTFSSHISMFLHLVIIEFSPSIISYCVSNKYSHILVIFDIQ